MYKRKFIRFGFVGGLGTLTNLFIFFLFVDVLKFPDLIIQISGFVIAVTQNFILNSAFTFKDESVERANILFRYIKFVLTSITGLIINLIVYNILNFIFKPDIKVICQAFGILAGMSVNFLGSKFFVFRKNKINS